MRKDVRIGVTMRVTEATNYKEVRDSIAMDWAKYLKSELPTCKWMFIPNIEEDAVAYFQKWNLNVLILTGGDDIGKYPSRDITEISLLQMANRNNIPIIGICRGMQLIHTYFNGKLEKGIKYFIKNHRNNQHLIVMKQNKYITNSFHSNKIDEATVHKDFKIVARCDTDNSIEAFEKPNVLGVMWHPERTIPYQKWNSILIKEFIEKYVK